MVSRFFLLLVLSLVLSGTSLANLNPALSFKKKCVNIYFDQVGEGYTLGEIHSIFVRNLVAHFPNIQQYVSPISKYKKGDLGRCTASIYLGTHFHSPIPQAFFEDYKSTPRNILWAGYNVWKLGPKYLEKTWGVSYSHLTKLDEKNRDKNGHPGFFKFNEYKGEIFTKYGKYDKNVKDRFNAAFELTNMSFTNILDHSRVVSWAMHSSRKERIPYILRNRNKWYIAESPFSFATEDDRYLIFSDILFDLLEEEPHYTGKRPAIFRLEDIHAELELWPLFNTINTIKQYKIPFQVSLIPIFTDPLNENGVSQRGHVFTSITQKPGFIDFLNYIKSVKGEFILHGITHQSGLYPNPIGTSGDDFEFWDIVKNSELEDDSVDYVLDRMELGVALLDEINITPEIWLTPHYQASPLNNVMFGQLFDWVIGRVIYFPGVEINQSKKLPAFLNYNSSLSENTLQRREYFIDLKVAYDDSVLPNGQFFPYEIYGDIFGQKVIPESLGNIQPFFIPGVDNVKSVDEMIATMKRNRVIRDAWASFFFHPFLLKGTWSAGISRFPQDVAPIRKLIEAAKKYGYEFISLSEWKRKAGKHIRPEPVIIK